MAPKLSKENLDILNNAKDKMNRDIDSINAIKETFDPKDDTYKATTSALSYIESTLDLMGKSVKGGNAVTTIGTMVATLNSMKEDWQKTNTINIGNVLSLMSDLTALGSMIGSFNPLLKFGLGALSVALAGLALLVDDTNISLDDILSVFDSVKSDFDQILQFLLSDSPTLVSVSDITVKEDDGKAVFNIQVNNPTDTPMKLHIWTSDNSAVSNNATGDFVAVDETITIPVNKNNLSNTIPVEIYINKDNAYNFEYEKYENFKLNVEILNTNDDIDDLMTFSTRKAQAVCTIIDTQPQITINNITVNENSKYAVFEINLNRALNETLEFKVYSLNGNNPSIDAVANQDYEPIMTTAKIIKGQTKTIVAIKLIDDTQVENNEKFGITAYLDYNQARKFGLNSFYSAYATIIDDDKDNGDDNQDKPDETDGTDSGTTTDDSTNTIWDKPDDNNDDNDNTQQPLSIRVSNPTVYEKDGEAMFEIFLSRPIDENLTLEVFTQNGSALAGTDYEYESFKITINAGAYGVTAPIKIFSDDESPEANETFKLIVKPSLADKNKYGLADENKFTNLNLLVA